MEDKVLISILTAACVIVMPFYRSIGRNPDKYSKSHSDWTLGGSNSLMLFREAGDSEDLLI